MTAPVGVTAFFDAVRPLFNGKLSQSQVDGLNVILDGFTVYGDGSATKLAYVLATAFHETGRTMQPVKETQFTADVPTDATVKARLTKAWKAGKMKWVKRDYWSGGFFGRGYVQLTHEDNYARASKAVGFDLVADPSKALQPAIAVQVLVQGMMQGWFTGKKLGDYITGTGFDFKQARRIVNGTESAAKIAGYAEQFLIAVRAAEAATKNAAKPSPAPKPAETPNASQAKDMGQIEPYEEGIAEPPKRRPFPWAVILGGIALAALAAFGLWPTE